MIDSSQSGEVLTILIESVVGYESFTNILIVADVVYSEM
jgi:hypothetical protein